MRKWILAAALVAVVPGCGLIGMAENEAEKDANKNNNSGGGGGGGYDPTAYMVVSDIQYSYYDLSALKAGDWVEYETSASGTSSKSRTACVGIEGNLVWIETSAGQPNWFLVVAVDKTDGKAKKAYAGEAGKEGKEIKIQATGTGDTTQVNYKTEGTIKYYKDSATVKAGTFEGECTESSSTTTVEGAKSTAKSRSWASEKVPFRYDLKKTTLKNDSNNNWKIEGKPSVNGGIVKTTTEGDSAGTKYTSTMELVGMGTDAKMSIKIPASK
jgi:hypothetical protein